ncbi:MAG: hypothetical protein KME18_25260 [Phormidium tanganyikae FI6-MK23]|jgi:tetratricopeptide (TPR) repeat protein|nr:hypothetical protein [Phormidium tanganyikae FI6-MK23]
MKRSLLFLISAISLLPPTLPIVPVQAQSTQSCSQPFAYDIGQPVFYPTQPLSTIVASNLVLRQIAELNEIAQSTAPLDSIGQTRLDRWLIGKPDNIAADPGVRPQVALLLEDLSQKSEKAQLLNRLDRLAVRLERLPDTSGKVKYITALVRFYPKLDAPDRATSVLNRVIQSSLKQPNAQLRAANLGELLATASDLKQSPKIAASLSAIESVVVPAMRSTQKNPTVQVTAPLSLVQAYVETQQPAKALKLIDQVAKFSPPSEQNPDMARLYLRLDREDKAMPYLTQLVKKPIVTDDIQYFALVTTYDKPTELSRKLFANAWDQVVNLYPQYRLDAGESLKAYFQAGGSPDRIEQVLKSSSPQLKATYLLMVAGEYRQRNQPQKSMNAIEQFVQVTQQLQSIDPDPTGVQQAVKYDYLLEATTAFRRLASSKTIGVNPLTIPLAEKLKAVDSLEALMNGYPNSDPEFRLKLLQQFTLAYARQDSNKAIAYAQQLPRQDADLLHSPRAEALVQIAVIQHQSGQTVPAQSTFAMAVKVAESITNPALRAFTYGAISSGYLKIGQAQAAETARRTAVRWAKAVPNDPARGTTFINSVSSLAQRFVDENQVEAAWQTLQEIPKTSYGFADFSDLVRAALRVGQLDIARKATDVIYKYQPLESSLQAAIPMARAYLSRNQGADAIAILDPVASKLKAQSQPPVFEISQVIQLYVQAGRIDAARQLLAKYPDASSKQALQQYVNCSAQRGTGAKL